MEGIPCGKRQMVEGCIWVKGHSEILLMDVGIAVLVDYQDGGSSTLACRMEYRSFLHLFIQGEAKMDVDCIIWTGVKILCPVASESEAITSSLRFL